MLQKIFKSRLNHHQVMAYSMLLPFVLFLLLCIVMIPKEFKLELAFAHYLIFKTVDFLLFFSISKLLALKRCNYMLNLSHNIEDSFYDER
jgi:hypothetical protein